jgi:hypothetical protein
MLKNLIEGASITKLNKGDLGESVGGILCGYSMDNIRETMIPSYDIDNSCLNMTKEVSDINFYNQFFRVETTKMK